MDLNNLTNQPGEWLKGVGPEVDIVISSRIRLARNVDGYPFLTTAKEEEKRELLEVILRQLRKLEARREGEPPLMFLNLNEVSHLDRLFLVERHLISKELALGKGDRAVVLDSEESLSIMVNEEDHLRIQALCSGFQLNSLWEKIDRLDDEISQLLPYAFHKDWGMLTACPSNVGTGMRVSVMLHLPALVMTHHIDRVFQTVQKINFTVRGFYGEGTQALGDFYQISNQITLGRSEEDLIKSMQELIPQIVKYERTVRHSLLDEKGVELEDRVWRAYGMLKNARVISSKETMDLLSAVRMGVNLNLIDEVNVRTINELFIQTQPAHLQKLEGCTLPVDERDIRRAAYIRSRLN
ncbi:MAG: protein arginine kinase [Planctomycetota bacterium]|nr:MAG: protein arginine kinase [Planctomycetota bacterium]